jgi:hypothetical protein
MNRDEVRGPDAEESRNRPLRDPAADGEAAVEKSRPRRDAAANRRRLLAAARRLLDRGEVVSARELAAAAGLSVATLYRHPRPGPAGPLAPPDRNRPGRPRPTRSSLAARTRRGPGGRFCREPGARRSEPDGR